MLRFLQTGDWHLGQAYRKFDANLADRLRASRLEVIGRILREAERSGSAFVAVTGDQFDGPRPDPLLVRGMLDRIGASKVAGPHDPGQPRPLRPGLRLRAGRFQGTAEEPPLPRPAPGRPPPRAGRDALPLPLLRPVRRRPLDLDPPARARTGLADRAWRMGAAGRHPGGRAELSDRRRCASALRPGLRRPRRLAHGHPRPAPESARTDVLRRGPGGRGLGRDGGRLRPGGRARTRPRAARPADPRRPT